MNFHTGKVKPYSDLVINLNRDIILKTFDDEKEQIGKAAKDLLFGRNISEMSLGKKSSREEDFSIKLFKTYSEIAGSYALMENILVYINSFPLKTKKISKYDYFRYHIENYLHEIYIMDQRLLKYLIVLEKLYKKSKIKSDVFAATKALREATGKVFKGYVDIRGIHVHQNRYSDYNMDRLSLFDLFSNSNDKKAMRALDLLEDMAYREIRKKWKIRIKKDVIELHGFLEQYFTVIHKAVTKKGLLIRPWDK